MPAFGILFLLISFYCAFTEKSSGTISFLDLTSIVLVGFGLMGALMLALPKATLLNMLSSFYLQFFKTKPRFSPEEFTKLKEDYLRGERSPLVSVLENSNDPVLTTAVECLLQKSTSSEVNEKFYQHRKLLLDEWQPVIEGWELGARMAPAFGMLGTISGIIHVFQNMSTSSANIGGAMAMALLTTLYGVAIGAALFNPLASRQVNLLNQDLTNLDAMEKSVLAAVD